MPENIMREVRDYVMHQELLKPITTVEIQKYIGNKFDVDKKVVNTYIKRVVDKEKNIKRHKKGVYYKTKHTPFGDARLNTTDLIKMRYLINDDLIIGYETGPSFFHKLGLTTQMSKYLYIKTKKVTTTRKDNKMGIVLIAGPKDINIDNYKYYQFLDILDNHYKTHIELDDKYDMLYNYIEKNELKYEKLIYYAEAYSNIKIYKELAKIVREGK